MSGSEFWHRMGSRGPDAVDIDGVRVAEGSRVRLAPRRHVDILDAALAGRIAVVEAIEQDDEGGIHLAVTVEDDPGRDLGDARMPGHRFFYPVDDVRPLAPEPGHEGPVRVLVAGIGNMFLGDDGFGCEVARRMAGRPPMVGVEVVDFGIRGMDLVYALQRDYRGAILVDASPRGYDPGTLTVVEPRVAAGAPASVQTHGMDPVKVLALARALGGIPPRTYVVCCEPESVPVTGPDEEVVVALSAPVRASLDAAVELVAGLAVEIIEGADNADPGRRAGPGGRGGDERGKEAVDGDAVERRHGHGRDAGHAVAGDPAVPADAADVAEVATGARATAADGGRETADVPGHSG